MNFYSKKNNSEIIQISLKMPLELYNDIKKLSEDSERTISDQVRFIIKEYLKIKKG